jgi:hypothetical protein
MTSWCVALHPKIKFGPMESHSQDFPLHDSEAPLMWKLLGLPRGGSAGCPGVVMRSPGCPGQPAPLWMDVDVERDLSKSHWRTTTTDQQTPATCRTFSSLDPNHHFFLSFIEVNGSKNGLSYTDLNLGSLIKSAPVWPTAFDHARRNSRRVGLLSKPSVGVIGREIEDGAIHSVGSDFWR